MKKNYEFLEILDMREYFTGSSDAKFHPGLTNWKVFIEESKENKDKLIEIKSAQDPLYDKYKSNIHESCFPQDEETLKKYGIQNCIRILPHDCDTSKLNLLLILR